MVRWYHWLNRYEFEQTPGDSEGHGNLACCSTCSHIELDMTERLNNNNNVVHRLWVLITVICEHWHSLRWSPWSYWPLVVGASALSWDVCKWRHTKTSGISPALCVCAGDIEQGFSEASQLDFVHNHSALMLSNGDIVLVLRLQDMCCFLGLCWKCGTDHLSSQILELIRASPSYLKVFNPEDDVPSMSTPSPASCCFTYPPFPLL